MAENSKIQWTDHTVNFWTGCKKVSAGCKYCYMYRDKERFNLDPTDVIQVKQKTIDKVLRTAKAGDKIFTCSWSDFFIKEADEWRDWAWDIIRSRPDLNWQILTKRPQRIKECLPEDWGTGWDNVWIGVSVENQEAVDLIQYLFYNFIKVRFVSVEPIIGEVDLTDAQYGNQLWNPLNGALDISHANTGALDWVIIGGESGNDNGKYRYRPAEMHWFERVITDCQDYGVPVFMKQTGTYLAKRFALSDRHGGNIDDFPEALKIREFPKKYIDYLNELSSQCECLDCGHTWNPFNTEHFNFTCCEVCFSDKIGGGYHQNNNNG